MAKKHRNKPDTTEIRERLDEQIYLAEMLRRAAAPHGDTLCGAVPQFRLLEAALAAHVGKLQEIRNAL